MSGCASNSTSPPSRHASLDGSHTIWKTRRRSRETVKLPRKLEQLRAEIKELEAALDDDATQERLMTAINLVGRDLTGFATHLGLEHGENPGSVSVCLSHRNRMLNLFE